LKLQIGVTNYYLTLERQARPMASNFLLSKGSHNLVFVDKQSGCRDSVNITVNCTNPAFVVRTIYVNSQDTICLATDEMRGRQYQITNACEKKSGEKVVFSLVPTSTCVISRGVEEGVEYACFVLADEFGVTDTTYMTINVLARKSALYPVAIKDAATTATGKPVIIDVMKNDTINGALKSIAIISQPSNGTAFITIDNKIVYRPKPGYCSSTRPEELTYMICTNNGCSVATVLVTVLCDQIIVYNAMSPNGDGVNDNLIIEGLHNYPNNKIQIFNRWGNTIFTTEGYHNEFDGTWDNKLLPDGTFFYILEDGEGKTYSGYFEIKR
jgi:gliding motility-associated-like protein